MRVGLDYIYIYTPERLYEFKSAGEINVLLFDVLIIIYWQDFFRCIKVSLSKAGRANVTYFRRGFGGNGRRFNGFNQCRMLNDVNETLPFVFD